MNSKYTIGLDYGTLSARGILLDIITGEEVATAEYAYPHKVMDSALPCGTPLGVDWALQDPDDYIEALIAIIKELIDNSKVSRDDVIGIGVDFTSCTILPTTTDGTPLCKIEEYKSVPHAYVKLWKHHAAQYCADRLNEVATRRGEKWLQLYGGKISSEWVIPKAMQIAIEAPEVYEAADRIIEAGDWVVWQLTGVETRSACNAGYKAIYHHRDGYPSKEFFRELDVRLTNIVREKLEAPILPLGGSAGGLCVAMAERLGLNPGTSIATEIVDAHACVPACKIDGPGKMLMIMGTSTCHMLLSKDEQGVPGTCGIVKDGILPGLFAYEAGQSCVGDHFAWLADNLCPYEYMKEAQEQGISLHSFLTKKASYLKPGESGLLALDWWNGVRSDLMDFDLSGMIIGLTLATKAEDIYRALIEATAYGTRQIINCFERGGVPVTELYAAGGIAQKNPLVMQIYADVCKLPIKISGSSQSGALGSAIYAAGAAGELSGYKDVNEAASKLGKIKDKIYYPIGEHMNTYDVLFEEYVKLHDYFGKGENNVMKKLKELSQNM